MGGTRKAEGRLAIQTKIIDTTTNEWWLRRAAKRCAWLNLAWLPAAFLIFTTPDGELAKPRPTPSPTAIIHTTPVPVWIPPSEPQFPGPEVTEGQSQPDPEPEPTQHPQPEPTGGSSAPTTEPEPEPTDVPPTTPTGPSDTSSPPSPQPTQPGEEGDG